MGREFPAKNRFLPKFHPSFLRQNTTVPMGDGSARKKRIKPLNQVGPYTLGSTIGQGSVGKVKVATHSNGKQVGREILMASMLAK